MWKDEEMQQLSPVLPKGDTDVPNSVTDFFPQRYLRIKRQAEEPVGQIPETMPVKHGLDSSPCDYQWLKLLTS